MAKVQYIGKSDVRQITKKDWDSIDIDHDTVTWTKLNPDHLPVVDFGEGDLPEDIDMYFADDPDFKVYKDDATIPRSGRQAVKLAERRAEKDGQEPGVNTGGLGAGGDATGAAATDTTAATGSTGTAGTAGGKSGGGPKT